MKSTNAHIADQKLQQAISVYYEQPRAVKDNNIQNSLQRVFSKRAKDLAARRRNHILDVTRLPILVFEIGNEQYGIKLGELAQITPVQNCTPIPTSAPYVVGIVNLGGIVSSVIDLAHLIGHDKQDAKSGGYVLFLRSSNCAIGFRIDAVRQVEYTTQDELDATDHMPLYAHGVTKNGVCLLNIQQLIESKLDTTY